MSTKRRSSNIKRWIRPIKKQLVADVKTAKKWRLSLRAGLVLATVMLPICWMFDRIGKLDLVMPIATCIMGIGFAIAIKWNLRHRFWFWITMAIIGAAHAVALVSLTWTDKWHPGAMYAGIASLDICAIFLILAVLQSVLGGPKIETNFESEGLTS